METRDKIKMPSFDFLLTNVRRQRELAEQTLKRAEEIDELLEIRNLMDPTIRKALEEIKQELLSIANKLARNANATIASANAALEMLMT